MSETRMEYGGECGELSREAKLPPTMCCGSCHDDVDDGHSQPSEREYRGKQYDVCCVVATAFDVAHPRFKVEEAGRRGGKTDLAIHVATSAPPPEDRPRG